MSRAVRRVPEGWQHPVEARVFRSPTPGRVRYNYRPEFVPLVESDMVELFEGEPTHWQMYEETSEGTPISPVCATPELLATWLVANGATVFAGTTATYEQWLAMITGSGATVGAVVYPGGRMEPGWLDGQGG